MCQYAKSFTCVVYVGAVCVCVHDICQYGMGMACGTCVYMLVCICGACKDGDACHAWISVCDVCV